MANPRLALLLAMAMFVLVVDTSLMNVSISAVVRGSRHDRQRCPVGDRARSAGVRRVHPDRQQDRRPLRAQAGVCAGSARLRRRRAGDDARPGPDRDHHLLGGDRWARRVAPAAGDAVARSTATSRVRRRRRPTPWSGPRQRSPPRSDRCSAASSPPISPGAWGSCSRPSSSRSCCPASNSSATCRTPDRGSIDVVGAVLSVAGHGRHRAGHPGVAGRRRIRRRAAGDRRGRAGGAGLLARAAQARGQADADRPRPVQVQDLQARASPSRCSSRSRWAA